MFSDATWGIQNTGPVYRPTVINCYNKRFGEKNTLDNWWNEWMEFMFEVSGGLNRTATPSLGTSASDADPKFIITATILLLKIKIARMCFENRMKSHKEGSERTTCDTTLMQ